MSKFTDLVEITKKRIEKDVTREMLDMLSREAADANLPRNVNDVFYYFPSEWYDNLLFAAHYSYNTIEKKVKNMDWDRIANALDDWYINEFLPQLLVKIENKFANK